MNEAPTQSILMGYDRQSNPTPKASDTEKDESSSEVQRERSMVRLWQGRIKKAKEKWEPDFDRMRENMEFVAGIQWPGQTEIKCDKYIVNLTLQTVNRGVALLYARNPTVEAKRRKRLDFRVWDGHVETIIQSIQTAQQIQMMGASGMGQPMPVPPQILAVLQDYQDGRQRQKLIERVGRTLEILYQYQMDSQQPSFKTQMKQLVRRVRVCGVGYIKVDFCRSYDEPYMRQTDVRFSLAERRAVVKRLHEMLNDKKFDENSAKFEELVGLMASLQEQPTDAEQTKVKEHLVFDFPQATSIIPDPKTRSLKGFVGARWIAEELYYPLEYVNAFYGIDIKPGGELKLIDVGRREDEGNQLSADKEDLTKRDIRLWEVTNMDSKERFTIADGWKDFVCKPETVMPSTKAFWTTFPVTFNDVETEEGCKCSIFPPSDVDLLKPIQKEKNRVGQALRRHRKANAPRYVYPEGTLDEEDLDKLEGAEDQQFFGLKGITPGTEPGKVVQPLVTEDIKPALYDTRGLSEDALLATGTQEANIGPTQPNVTATAANVSEQSRQTVAASDIDGLDDTLTEVAKCGGEMLLQEASVEVVQEVVGPGAAWPDENRAEFLNEIELSVVAASSGRPNKGIELQNWQQVAPLIMQAAQMPPQAQPTAQAVIRETLKRLEDSIEPADFFPIPMPVSPTPEQGPDVGASKRTPPKMKGRSPGPSNPPNRPQPQPAQ